MKAMILAAGLGTRLGALTKDTPKCLIEVAGRPMLVHVIEKLQAAGVDSVVINLHYQADKVKAFLAQKSFGLQIEFTYEAEILGTGGGIRNAQHLLEAERDFLVYNTDVYSELDLLKLVEAHRSAGALATLAVMDLPAPSALLFDPQGNLAGWDYKGKRECFVQGLVDRLNFSGIQVISPDLFKYMQGQPKSFSSIASYLVAARAGERVRAFRMDGVYWLDMGTPEELETLRQKLKK